ncbi:DUF995 domain-containing protein [Brucella intermedia]
MTILKSERSPNRGRIGLLIAIVTAAFTLAGPVYAEVPQNVVLPAGARAMTAVEIFKLYRNKSWQWENGAGRMKVAGRHFSAWIDSGEGKSWAEGRWVITHTGQMCLKATWHSANGAAPGSVCFSHRVHDGTVYQKREPDGGWYVFRHSKPQEGDEASKLMTSDLVSERLEGMKAVLSSTQTSEQ